MKRRLRAFPGEKEAENEKVSVKRLIVSARGAVEGRSIDMRIRRLEVGCSRMELVPSLRARYEKRGRDLQRSEKHRRIRSEQLKTHVKSLGDL